MKLRNSKLCVCFLFFYFICSFTWQFYKDFLLEKKKKNISVKDILQLWVASQIPVVIFRSVFIFNKLHTFQTEHLDDVLEWHVISNQ